MMLISFKAFMNINNVVRSALLSFSASKYGEGGAFSLFTLNAPKK